VNLYRRVISYYRSYLGTICFSLMLMVVAANLNLIKFWPIRWVIDHVVTVKSGTVNWTGLSLTPAHAALVAALSLVALWLLAALLGFWRNYVSIEVGLKALLQLRTQLYSYLQHLPLHFHDRRRSGDSTFRVAYDSQAIQTFFNRGFDTIFGSVITLATTFAYMWAMDASLACFSLLILPLLWLTIYFFANRVRSQTTRLQQEESDVLARASEGLSAKPRPVTPPILI
jgi:ATP-binding cassette subfamily B protein